MNRKRGCVCASVAGAVALKWFREAFLQKHRVHVESLQISQVTLHRTKTVTGRRQVSKLALEAPVFGFHPGPLLVSCHSPQMRIWVHERMVNALWWTSAPLLVYSEGSLFLMGYLQPPKYNWPHTLHYCLEKKIYWVALDLFSNSHIFLLVIILIHGYCMQSIAVSARDYLSYRMKQQSDFLRLECR